MATRSYWLVNSNRSRVKRFIENTNNKDKFFNYMFIDSGKVLSMWGQEPPVMTTREELKKEAAREEWKKLIALFMVLLLVGSTFVGGIIYFIR